MPEILKLKKGHDRRLKSGHLWVFSNELEDVPSLEPGTLVEVINSRRESFGVGFYNPHSLIAVRLLLADHQIDTGFFTDRISRAFAYRKLVLPGEETFRLSFGESDFLPGLVVDKYGDYISLQVLSAGMETRLDNIIEALLHVLPDTKAIIEKNHTRLRELEGLPLREGTIYGSLPEEFEVIENNIRLSISLSEGQKTGYFLDQKINRNFIRSISKDLKVLDCFCNQGGFALNAAAGGASLAVGIDSSLPAIERARNNSLINNFNNTDYIIDDVVSFLQMEISKNNNRDMIILDPPAFARSRKSVPTARAGYAKINKLAMKLLSKYGFLATSSCSQHITEDVFYEIILKESASLNRQLKLVYRGMQSPDHPVLASMPETRYLKFFVFQVI